MARLGEWAYAAVSVCTWLSLPASGQDCRPEPATAPLAAPRPCPKCRQDAQSPPTHQHAARLRSDGEQQPTTEGVHGVQAGPASV